MPKKYVDVNQKHISSSPKLNLALSIIKENTGMPYRCIMEQLAIPLSEIVASKSDATFCVMPYGDTVTIAVFGKPLVKSGKNQPLNQVVGVD